MLRFAVRVPLIPMHAQHSLIIDSRRTYEIFQNSFPEAWNVCMYGHLHRCCVPVSPRRVDDKVGYIFIESVIKNPN